MNKYSSIVLILPMIVFVLGIFLFLSTEGVLSYLGLENLNPRIKFAIILFEIFVLVRILMKKRHWFGLPKINNG
jgi:hypothetical protein